MHTSRRYLKDFLTHQTLLTLLATTRETERASMNTLREGVVQRRQAAEALWSNGHPAEGLRLLIDAFQGWAEYLEQIEEEPTQQQEEEPSPENSMLAAFVSLGFCVDTWKSLTKSVAKASCELPALDRDVGAEHGQLYRRMSTEMEGLEILAFWLGLERVALMRSLVWRRACVAFVMLLGLVAAVLALRTPVGIVAQSSGSYQGERQFNVERLIDGDPGTEWLLDNGELGWAQLNISPPRALSGVRILNAHNREYNDRATARFQMQFFAGEELLEEQTHSFAALERDPEWVDYPVSLAGVDRIRIEIQGFHQVGAGLAEFALVEAD